MAVAVKRPRSALSYAILTRCLQACSGVTIDLPTSDGTALFVPAYVETFDTAPENFAVYKVAILHQLGFYDCGTFTFRLHEWQRLSPHVQLLLPRPQGDTHWVSAFEQFFCVL